WNYDASGVVFRASCYYIVKSSAADNVANGEASWGTSRFKFMPPPAQTRINAPENLKFYKALSLISGTANADAKQVELEVRRLSDTWYWNFGTSGWQAAVSSVTVIPSGGNWSRAASLPPLVSGSSYSFRSVGLSYSDVYEAGPVVNQVYFDTDKPTALVQLPAAAQAYYKSLPGLGGTAQDPPGITPPAAGVSKVWVELYAVNGPDTGKYWDNATSAFTDSWNQAGNAGSYYVAASSWEYVVSYPTAAYTNGSQFRVRAKSLDNTFNNSAFEGIESDFSAGNLFSYDITVPTAVVTAVTPGQSRSGVSIASGTLSEDYVLANSIGYQPGTQIQGVVIRIRDNKLIQYWAGSGWDSSPAASTSAAVYQSSWSLSALPAWADDGSYTLWAEATDKAGNVQANFTGNGSSVTFSTDKSAPLLSVLSPAANSKISSVVSVTGTANDPNWETNSGIAGASNMQVQVSYLLTGDTYYYDNSASFSSSTLNDSNSWWNSSLWVPQGPSSGTWTYNPVGLPSAMVGDKVYRFRARAQDNAIPLANPASLMANAVTNSNVIYDLTKPVSRILFPLDQSRLKALVSVNGTALDNLAGISTLSQLAVSLEEISPASAHWNGVYPGTFTLNSEAFQPLSEPTLAASYAGGNWSFTAPTLRDGYTYLMKVRASDDVSPPNVETEISSVTFTYDTTPPAAAITYPFGLPDLRANIKEISLVSGTAYEQFAIRSASVSVQEADTLLYYDTQSSTFNSATQKWITAAIAGTGPNYTWSVAAPTLTDNKNYNLQITADDAAYNQLTPPSATVIRFDKSEPLSRPTLPVNNEYLKVLTSVSGTAVDINTNPSLVAGSQIKIQRPNGEYWSGSSWGPETWLGAVSGSPWVKNTQLPPSDNATGLQDGLLYTVFTRAYDVAGNTQSVVAAGNSFTFDVSSPTAYIGLPLNGARKISLPLVSGTANDAFNVNFPLVRVYDIATDKYWMEGSGSCGTSPPLPAWVGAVDSCPSFPEIWNVALDSSSASGGFSWRYDSSALLWPNRDNELRLEAKVLDRAGNYSVTSSTFSFDDVAPESKIIYPPVSGVFYSSMAAISGTSYDLTSAINNVQIRMWYLSGPSTYYWQPTTPHWSASDTGWWSIANGPGPKGTINPWSYTNSDFSNPGTVNFAWKEGTHDNGNGKTFYMVTKAVDGTTNQETALSTRTFVFDNVPPLSAPVQPGVDTSYNNLPVIYGTSVDASTSVASARISILSQDEAVGPRYFNGSAFVNPAETWLPILATSLFPSSWTYTNGLLSFTIGFHYIVKSSATDFIGNVQDVLGQSRFLFDQTEPQSAVVSPVNTAVYNDNKVMLGNASDTGFTTGIDGTGSGVYPTLPWHQGKIETLVFRDTAPFLASNGPINSGGYDDSGYFWNGSTWTPSAGGEVWVPAQFTDSLGNWQYSGLVCDDQAERDAFTCWVRGDSYVSWIRVTDNAGNIETIVDQGPKFYIAAPAQSFLVTVAVDPITAGSDVNMTVEARDGAGGGGNPARAYQGAVNFYIDGVPGGPETMDTDDYPATMDDTYGLPKQYTFLPGDYGVKTFQVRPRKIGARTLRAEDRDNPAIFGSRNVTVNPTIADRLQVIADYDPAGQMPSPGSVTGRTGMPRLKPAGSNVPFLLQVTDKYWNLVVSSAANVFVADTDPNNDNLSPDAYLNFVGSATIYRTLVSASVSGWNVSASGQGLYTNVSNPSSNVSVVAQAADRLLAMFPGETRVQGKWDVQPFGKTGAPSALLAGATFQAVVYGVDNYYNTDLTAGFKVYSSIPTDAYDINPSSNTLVSGATSFIFTPVIAATHTIKAESSSLPPATSVYYTPDPATVWWNRPVKLHLVAPGQGLRPGLPAYGANPSPGGKSGSASPLTAGSTAQMSVYLVDNYYNVVAGTTPFMAVSSNTPLVQIDFPNDANIQLRGMHPSPYQRALIAGVTNFSVIPVTRNQSPGLSVKVMGVGATGSLFSTDTVSGIVVNPAPAAKLLLLVPNETAVEGIPGGKTGTAGPLTAGTTYTISVRAVDVYDNLVDDGRIVKLLSNDIYAVHPPAQSLDGGIADIAGFVPSAATSNLVIDAIDFDSIPLKLSTSTDSGIVVNPGTASRLIVLLPTQFLVPGKVVPPYGVSGSISTQTAGVYFDAQVYSADNRYNRVFGINRSNIRVTTDDPFLPTIGLYTMTDGSATVNDISLRTAGPRFITLSDLSGDLPALGNTSSGGFLLTPNTPTKLRAMIQGESRVAGSTGNGRTGSPDSGLKAGFPFTVTVDIADAFWNLTPGASQQVRLVIDDTLASVVPPSQVITGSATFTVTPIRAGTTVLRAETDAPGLPGGPTLSQDIATTITVAPGVPKRLLMILPGESFSQSSPGGRTGLVTDRKAGTNFGVRVGVVDDYFNLVPGRPADVVVNIKRRNDDRINAAGESNRIRSRSAKSCIASYGKAAEKLIGAGGVG
ncbi:MAG: hypothetical protein COX65_08550, partial [Elusimicrobia bacterium CG_4_10_14_0_2_um_filter_56_8]